MTATNHTHARIISASSLSHTGIGVKHCRLRHGAGEMIGVAAAVAMMKVELVRRHADALAHVLIEIAVNGSQRARDESQRRRDSKGSRSDIAQPRVFRRRQGTISLP